MFLNAFWGKPRFLRLSSCMVDCTESNAYTHKVKHCIVERSIFKVQES